MDYGNLCGAMCHKIFTECFKSKFNDRSWDNIEVPFELGNVGIWWQNVSMGCPFHANVPFGCDYSLAGALSQRVSTTKQLNGHQVLRFEKVLLSFRWD